MWTESGQTHQEGPVEFVPKLYQMLETPEFREIVGWSERKDSFVIFDMTRFQQEVIPKTFHHSNFSSFVRQLNKYDFHKVRFRDAYSKLWEFQHEDFKPLKRDQPHLIKRKVPGSRSNVSQVTIDELQEQISELQDWVRRLEGETQHLRNTVSEQSNAISCLLARCAQRESIEAQPQGNKLPSPVLLAMDDPEAREICARFLKECGCMVETAFTGTDVVHLAETRTYTYIIIDLVLPVLNGLAACDIIRRSNVHTPIILCMESSDADSSKYVEHGVSGLLTRPFTKSMLQDLLHKLSR